MTSIGESTLSHAHVPQLDSVVHTAGDQEITRIMPVDFPDRLTMLDEGVSTLGLHEVPHFHCAITRTSS